MVSDYHSKNIQESLARLERTPSRVTAAPDNIEPDQYESLRLQSRTRIALMLRHLRGIHGLTYAQVQTDTGLSQQVLFDVEFGERRLSLSELALLAACYQVSINDILGVDIE